MRLAAGPAQTDSNQCVFVAQTAAAAAETKETEGIAHTLITKRNETHQLSLLQHTFSLFICLVLSAGNTIVRRVKKKLSVIQQTSSRRPAAGRPLSPLFIQFLIVFQFFE